MATYCSFFHSSTAFMTVFAPNCSADNSGLRILPLVNGFHDGSRAVFLGGWQRIAHSFSCQQLSRWFSRCIALRMALDYSFFCMSMAITTVCVLYCPAVGSGLLILALVNSFHDGLHAAFLSGWWRIAHCFSHQRLSQRFSRRIALQMAADCSFLRASTAFMTVYMPYCSSDSSLE